MIFYRRSVFENFYRQDLRFKKYKVDIGHFKPLRVTSNPKFWSPKDVHKYLSSDLYCTQIARKLYLEVGNINDVLHLFIDIF